MIELGEQLHKGNRRKVYQHQTDPSLIIKELIKPKDDHNEVEYQNWLWAVENNYEEWLAPCLWLSEDGQYLCQAKGSPTKAPPVFPAWIRGCRDFNSDTNWVEIDGRTVFADYGDRPFGIEEVGNVYHGKDALLYDERRVIKLQWHTEMKLMKTYLSLIHPETVLDIPVGTGRFLPLYDGQVTGVDISYPMLQQARKKARNCDIEYSTVYESIYSYEPVMVFDLVVCVRFLYWAQDLEIIKKLATWGRSTILSIWLGPETIDHSDGKKFHKEQDFFDTLREAGLSIQRQDEIERKQKYTHFMFLLETI